MKKIKILTFAAALLSLTSCLKDGNVNFAPGASPAVVEWSTAVVALVPGSVAVGSPYRLFPVSYDVTPSSDLKLQIGYTGGVAPTSDINVTIDLDPTAITAFNAAQTPVTTYEVLPAAFYTLPTSAVIAAGSSKANITIKINTAATGFDFAKKYVLPLRIKSVSGTSAAISGNYGTILVNVGAKNKYDGTYSFVSGAGSTLQPGITKTGAKLVTVAANQLTTSLLQTYTNVTTFTFDLATNKLTAVDVTGLGSASSIDPTSGYDPATKKIKAFYVIGTRTFEETYTYTGSR